MQAQLAEMEKRMATLERNLKIWGIGLAVLAIILAMIIIGSITTTMDGYFT